MDGVDNSKITSNDISRTEKREESKYGKTSQTSRSYEASSFHHEISDDNDSKVSSIPETNTYIHIPEYHEFFADNISGKSRNLKFR